MDCEKCGLPEADASVVCADCGYSELQSLQTRLDQALEIAFEMSGKYSEYNFNSAAEFEDRLDKLREG